MTEQYNIDNTNSIQLEKRNNPIALKYGVFLILFSVFISFFLNFNYIFFFNSFNFLNLGILSFSIIVFASTWVVRILVTIWLIVKAKLINRSRLVWGLLGFFIPSIALIVFSFLDYKLSEISVKKLLKKIRIDYNAELKQEKHNKALKPEELELVENRLKKKYKEKLSEEIVSLISKVKVDSIRELKAKGIIDSTIDINEQEYIIKQSILKKNSGSEISEEWNEKWLDEADKCPACGTKIDLKAVICPECGLTIK